MRNNLLRQGKRTYRAFILFLLFYYWPFISGLYGWPNIIVIQAIVCTLQDEGLQYVLILGRRIRGCENFDGMSLSLGTCALNTFLVMDKFLLGTTDTNPYAR